MAEVVSETAMPDLSKGIDHVKFTVDDPENTRGGEIAGEPYVQPGLFMHILKSLRPGQDLTKVLIPVFFLEPRSLLERLGDMLMHVDTLDSSDLLSTDPKTRFMCLLKWYLSSWHYKTHGCKKPFNPIIGETFSCVVDTGKSSTSYVAEQTSHHPPVSAFFIENQKVGFHANGYIWTKSNFTGNSATGSMLGKIDFYVQKFDEEYITMIPAFSGTGLFFGQLAMQLVDTVTFECAKTGFKAVIEFKAKPMFGGEFNLVNVTVSEKDKVIHYLSGKWNETFALADDKHIELDPVWLDVKSLVVLPKKVLSVDKQGMYESRKLWQKVTDGIRKRDGPDWKAVEMEKTKLEDDQRKLPCHQSDSKHTPWVPKLFKTCPHTGTGKMSNGFMFKWKDKKAISPGAAPRNFLALSRNYADPRGTIEPLK